MYICEALLFLLCCCTPSVSIWGTWSGRMNECILISWGNAWGQARTCGKLPKWDLSCPCVWLSVCMCVGVWVGDFITFVVDFVFRIFFFRSFFDFPKKFLIKSKRGGTGGCDGGHSKWPRADLGQGRRLQHNGMGCQLLCCHAPLRDLWFVVAVPTTTATTATKTSWETTQGFICNLHANRVGPVYKKQVLSRLLREKCVGGGAILGLNYG